MHIGMVHYAAPPTIGGVEQTIFHHARVLTALGHRVTVVADQGSAFWPGVAYHDEPLVGSRSPSILEAGEALRQGIVPEDFGSLVAQVRAALLKHLNDCDVVIGHNLFTLHKNLPLTAAVHELVREGVGPPWVAWHHDFAWLRPQYQPELHQGYPWELLRHAWPGVASVTVSEAQQADLALLYRVPQETIQVIPPGVAPSEFFRVGTKVGRLVEAWKLWEADCIFLLPARITRRKNIELGLRWLAAFRGVAQWDARLVITGPPGPHNPANDSYLQELFTLRDELGLQDAAHFVYSARALFGNEASDAPLMLDDEEIASLFLVADALLFPSRQEGFGIPMLEAGLARLSIFATDLPPFRESAGELATFFSPDDSPQEVAQTMLATLQQDRTFRLRRRVLERFTWESIVSQQVLPVLLKQAKV
jgi:mannosylglucosylglycerate synthase